MWHNNTLIDTSQANYFELLCTECYCLWTLSPELQRLVCVIVSLFSCPTLNKYYVLWMIYLTRTPLPWCHDLFFILYAFALYYNVCIYPLCTTSTFAIIIFILSYNVFPCALLVYNYNSLNECDLNFHFWKCDLDDLYGDVDMFIWPYWFLHLTFICIDDIYDKYYDIVWPLTFDWRQFLWVHLQFTSGHEFK